MLFRSYNVEAEKFKNNLNSFNFGEERNQEEFNKLIEIKAKLSDYNKYAVENKLTTNEALKEKRELESKFKVFSSDIKKNDVWGKYDKGIESVGKLKKFSPRDTGTIMAVGGPGQVISNDWNSGNKIGAVGEVFMVYPLEVVKGIGKVILKNEKKRKHKTEEMNLKYENKLSSYEKEINTEFNEYKENQKPRMNFLIAGKELERNLKIENKYRKNRNSSKLRKKGLKINTNLSNIVLMNINKGRSSHLCS